MQNNPIKLLFAPYLLLLLLIVSCQREISFETGGRITETDSSLLIKSIALVSDDPTVQDSVIENYSYDTAGKKITVAWTNPSGNFVVDGSSAEFSYDNNLLLTHVAFSYPATYTTGPGDYLTMDLAYDAQKVLQKITTKFADGTSHTNNYTKTTVASGYELNWDESDVSAPGTSLRKVKFDPTGKAMVNIQDMSFVADYTPLGDPIYTEYIVTDSFFYDAAGSVSRIRRTETDSLQHTRNNYLSYDFVGRLSKGDQLYNQRRALLNGIVNIPFGDGDTDGDGLSILGNGLDYDYHQYSVFPAQTVRVYNWNTNDYTFNTESDFDGLNRLVKFKGFSLDLGIYGHIFKIRYFK